MSGKPILWMAGAMVLLFTHAPLALPERRDYQIRDAYEDPDRIGKSQNQDPAKVNQDTIWVADWTFDGPNLNCDDTGWTLTDGEISFEHHWSVVNDFDGVGRINGDAAILADHDLCWVYPDGYDNDWYDAIRIEYTGDSFLSFDYIVDSEGSFDFLMVESDSACASFDLPEPGVSAATYRDVLFQASGLIDSARVDSVVLSSYGTGDTHCLYISFFSDGAFSPADGNQPTTLGIATAVDNIELTGGTNYSQDFTNGDTAGLTFVNLWEGDPSLARGNWSRLYRHITDNDLCTENKTCAWLHTNYGPEDPSIGEPGLDFGPGGYVIKPGSDQLVYSPWVVLGSMPSTSTVLCMRRFGGNTFSTGQIVHGWAVRGKTWRDNTDTPAPGDSIACVSAWGHSLQFNSLSSFAWITSKWFMDGFFPDNSTEIQLRFRVASWWTITGGPAPPGPTGPGPFWDDVRIGRVQCSGPVINEGIDARYQGQDAFATDEVQWSGPPSQESFIPRTTRFGTVAFSGADDINHRTFPNLITGDSITVDVIDVRGAGGISSVEVYGAIVEGPHQGQAPPPHSVVGGFFSVAADTARSAQGVPITNRWFVDMDDDYFLPGDVLHYFWYSTDVGGGVSSNPSGLTSLPADYEEAQAATQGLFETSFLPAVNWDSDIVAAAQAGANGKIPQADIDDPPANWTDEFGAVGEQTNCILYYQGVVSRRRSGDINRTTFMYTLDQLGYRDQYDVYDHQGIGNSNNQLGGRATMDQVTGYALIVYDLGNHVPISYILPDGSIPEEKIAQDQWFRDYLNNGSSSEAGSASLWLLASNIVQSKPTSSLFTNEMGLSFASGDQGLSTNPDVDGVASMTYANSNVVDYSNDLFAVQGGCPTIRDYDALSVTTGVETHTWKDPNSSALGDAAIIQNASVGLSWNTIMQAFPLSDMRGETATHMPGKDLVANVLGAVVPPGCLTQTPTDTSAEPELADVPARLALHGNYPNPFNPVTTIAFDVPQRAQVSLKVYDVAGRLVHTLLDDEIGAGRHQEAWDGLNANGRRVASGIYFVHMQARDFSATRKIVMTK